MKELELVSKLINPATRNFAFNQLVRVYQERIYFLIRGMVYDHDEANDLVQEVFIKVFKNLSKFREDSSLYTWIYRIATNECLNYLRKKKRRFFIPINDVAHNLEQTLRAGHYLDGDVVQAKLHSAQIKLPDKQRLVFQMKYYQEMKYEEIAEITGTSVGSLKASYHHAVRKIEEYLKDD